MGRGRGPCKARPKILWSKGHVASGPHASFNEVVPLTFIAFPRPEVQNPRSGRWPRFNEIYGGHTTMLHDPKCRLD
ncbi:unnamed protein product [Prunus brigantina]